MARYEVEVVQVDNRGGVGTVTVDANTPEEAEAIVKKMDDEGELTIETQTQESHIDIQSVKLKEGV